MHGAAMKPQLVESAGGASIGPAGTNSIGHRKGDSTALKHNTQKDNTQEEAHLVPASCQPSLMRSHAQFVVVALCSPHKLTVITPYSFRLLPYAAAWAEPRPVFLGEHKT
jgi:hypothetical protein